MKIVLILLVCCIGFVIGLFSADHEIFKRDVEIVKIRDCDYIFWEYKYGSDMEHYAGCVNPAHGEFRTKPVFGPPVPNPEFGPPGDHMFGFPHGIQTIPDINRIRLMWEDE